MRHLLQDEQLYYMCVLILILILGSLNETIVSTVLAFMLLAAIIAVEPTVGSIFQSAFTIPTIAMESNMACKMFRDMVTRSLDIDRNRSLGLTEACANAMSSFELATLQLDTRLTNEPLDCDDFYVRFQFFPCVHFIELMIGFWQSPDSY